MQTEHYSVLLNESVDGLVVDPDGFYIDGTFGRGGHSRKILSKLSSAGRVLAFDKDPVAVQVAQQFMADDNRLQMMHASFADMGEIVAEQQQSGKVAGVLLDLGVSSPQLDQPERGFSFQYDGPLDMRMDTSQGVSAQEWVNQASEEDITWVLKNYGEEKFAKRMARAIVQSRQKEMITTTAQLANIVAQANPAWEKGKNPATRAFQAIRIQVNNELQDLEVALQAALDILQPGGRLSVISFHSLEDRIVKQFIRRHERGDPLPKGLPVTENMLNKRLKSIAKAQKASAEEVAENTRSRSAVLRIAEKIK